VKPIPGAGAARYRWAVLSRIAAAVLGGYALAAASAASLAVWLPMTRVDAVVTASMLAFVVYAAGVMWVFAARDTWRAWAGIVLLTALLAGLFWLSRMMGAA